MSDQRQRLLDVAQAEGRLTSVVGAVLDRYGAVWAGGAGDAPGLDGQYRIGSITKTLTAVLVMQARDAGLLDLDDPLSRHLGDVGYGEVTVRDALAHTSGMQSEPRGEWWERTRGGDFTALARANDGSGRVAGPGELFHYSNLGYALLGEVVARRTGAPWRVLVAERLLQPLGMRATSYLPRPGAQPGWSVDHFTGIRVHEPLADTGAMAPAGQLWSTLADLVTWGQVLGGSRPDVLAPATLEEMRQPVTDDYGLGLMLGMHPGGRLVGHNGSMPGFLAALHVDPDSGIGAVVLTNATTGIDPRALAVSLIEGDPDADDTRPAPWRPTIVLPPEAHGVPGLWFWGNTAYDVRWHNEGLELRSMARGNVVTDRFEVVGLRLVGTLGYHRGEVLDVVRRPDGAIRNLQCATFVYTRTPYDPDVAIPGGHPR
ncbi:CubicO group peptidase (beta-lactamase class C family) [Nocardioides cavernae]|uniref:CubicO group peptidase (Beta-lactamase class C family) n=1 Tax=Nocardioides cavernae TaxID=1921566 RepID=A0A7Y9H542_9ACTN|nr:serine hydrolase domain-containing protein [Nocardioides cavernae]NYE38100.1 CubicO group peptidase (beta-lactamase class C family) [Nocardioides cavernae]